MFPLIKRKEQNDARVPAIRSEAIKQGYIIGNAKSPLFFFSPWRFWWCDGERIFGMLPQIGTARRVPALIVFHPDLFTTGLFSRKWKQREENQSEETVLFFVCVLVWIIVSEFVPPPLFFGGDFYFVLFSPLVSSNHRRQTQSPVGNYKVFSCRLFYRRLTPFQKEKRNSGRISSKYILTHVIVENDPSSPSLYKYNQCVLYPHWAGRRRPGVILWYGGGDYLGNPM